MLQWGYNPEEASELLKALLESVGRVEREVWVYQRNLSYFPEQ